MLSKASQEALLKILEEPPKHVHIMLCTTNPESLKPTFKRRCHQYELSPLTYQESFSLIKKVLLKEKKDITKFPKSVVEAIVDIADGSAGQALKLLDMIIGMTDKEKMLETLKKVGVSSDSKEVIDLCRALMDRNLSNGEYKWKRIQSILNNLKTEPESARRAILGYFHKVLLSSKDYADASSAAKAMSYFTENYYDSGMAGLTLSCFLFCLE
jgi:DNA polymerase III gamma/tau subunit